MPSNERWLLRDVTVDGRRLDCRIRDGRIAALAPALETQFAEQTIEGRAGALLAGLADHHIHLRALAATAESLDLGGAGLATAPAAPGDGWLRVVGVGELVTRTELDAVWPGRPVRAQHRSGAVWTLNSAAIEQLATGSTEDELATGRYWRAGDRLRAMIRTPTAIDLARLSGELARHGITHVTDATPDADPSELTVRQHVLSLAERGGGPRKLVVADHDLPDPDALSARVRQAHDDGRGVALHVVSSPALALALAALDQAGSNGRDRIEHAAVCDDAGADRLAALEVTVVTQPTIMARHRDRYLVDSEPHERPLLWRYGGLLRRGVRVAVSSDAPYGDVCPWTTIAAAAVRTDGEAVDPASTLATMLTEPLDPAGSPRPVAVDGPADLCLLEDGLDAVLGRVVHGATDVVHATFIDGVLHHRRPPSVN